jgi:DNA-directed RNA polymerase III subunit RPC7
MRRSAYFIVEEKKSTDLPRYSDKYKAEAHRPTLRKEDLNREFFPKGVFTTYFARTAKKEKRAKKRRKTDQQLGPGGDDLVGGDKLTLDQLMDMKEDDEGDEEKDQESDKASDDQVEADYDEDSDDNDYADNYFDNGEGDNDDDLGGGGRGGDDGTFYPLFDPLR